MNIVNLLMPTFMQINLYFIPSFFYNPLLIPLSICLSVCSFLLSNFALTWHKPCCNFFSEYSFPINFIFFFHHFLVTFLTLWKNQEVVPQVLKQVVNLPCHEIDCCWNLNDFGVFHILYHQGNFSPKKLISFLQCQSSRGTLWRSS